MKFNKKYDAIVIGSGMGGGTFARKYAEAGKKVLVIERGFAPSYDEIEQINRIRFNEAITVKGTFTGKFPFPLGSGLGGSSLLYAAQLERMFPHDFLSEDKLLNQTAWPINYEDFARYYQEAEILYKVKSVKDVLQNQANKKHQAYRQEIKKRFEDSDLDTSFPNMALSFVDNCNGCGGKVCLRNCKITPDNACLRNLNQINTIDIACESEVKKINTVNNSVESVEFLSNNETILVKAEIFVLACGALFTPLLLLNSRSKEFPNGIGNSFDQVGRNLMFHMGDFFAIRPRRLPKGEIPPYKFINAQLAKKDISEVRATVQSAGVNINAEYIGKFLKTRILRLNVKFIERCLFAVVDLTSYIGAFFFRQFIPMASILEDPPNPNNRVTVDPDNTSMPIVYYSMSEELAGKVAAFNSDLNALLSKNFFSIWVSGKNKTNYGHACGTCRVGVDKSSSVVDINCKVHDVENLYVVDASVFPVSSCVNPSLTIAANALRVATTLLSSEK